MLVLIIVCCVTVVPEPAAAHQVDCWVCDSFIFVSWMVAVC